MARMFIGYFLKESKSNDLKPIFNLYTRGSSVLREIWRKVLFSSDHLSSALEEEVLISILPHFLMCFRIHCGCGKRNYLTSWTEGKGNWEGHVWREISAHYSMSTFWGLRPISQGQTWQLPERFILKWNKEKYSWDNLMEPSFYSCSERQEKSNQKYQIIYKWRQKSKKFVSICVALQ